MVAGETLPENEKVADPVHGDKTDDAARWWRAYQLAENDRADELRGLAAAAGATQSGRGLANPERAIDPDQHGRHTTDWRPGLPARVVGGEAVQHLPVRPVTPAIPQPGKASPCLSATCRPQGTTRSGSRSCRWMIQATAQLGEIIDLIRVPCRTSAAYCRARRPNWSMASAVRCMRCSSTGPTGKSGSDMTAVTSPGS